MTDGPLFSYAVYLGRDVGEHTQWLTIIDGQAETVTLPRDEQGPMFVRLPIGADVALAEALAGRAPDAEWKARAEERQVALDREVARVDRHLFGGGS